MRTSLFVFLFSMMAISPMAAAEDADWPQLLGPLRNGVYQGTDLGGSWQSNAPPLVWQKSVGHGYSGPVVASHKLVLFHRVENQEIVECLDARTGSVIWTFAYPTAYHDEFGFDDGPRATPTISGGRVYTFGAEGMLHCLDFQNGKKVWEVNIKADFQAPNGFFGMACSPVVEGEVVLLNVGGAKGAGIVAFDKVSGKLRWKASDDEASYSSPVAATISGERYALFFTRNGFVALDPAKGAIRCQYPWHSRNRTSVNAATPLVVGDMIFLSACYGTGAILLRLSGAEPQKIWSGDDLLSNHYATSVELNGCLYGVHGRTDPGFSPRPKLRCVDLNKRTVRWETDSVGGATIIRAGGRLIVLTDKGELIHAPASPEAFQPEFRAQILSSEVRALPALAEGCFYARSKDKLICLDLRELKKK